jgi:hypothetical protein
MPPSGSQQAFMLLAWSTTSGRKPPPSAWIDQMPKGSSILRFQLNRIVAPS